MIFKIGDVVRIRDLPTNSYPCSPMKKHAGKVGRIIDIENNRAVLCTETDWIWLDYLLEKVGR